MKIQCQFVSNIQEVDKTAWNALVDKDFPFLRHEFLCALEQSKSVHTTTGWEPYHCVIFDQDRLIAAAPQYIKHHSYGEYVFDWAWADAYHQHQLDYYPKLITAIPFTPCVGPRLMTATDCDSTTLKEHFMNNVIETCESKRWSSWHILFPNEDEQYQGIMRRVGVQFHWYNQQYQSFNEFLAALSSSKRKNIRKERRKIHEQGFEFAWRSGTEINEQELRAFYACYHATYLKRGQQGYLNKQFFEQVIHTMPESLRLLLVYKQGEIVASALYFIGEQTLYGRYWGCLGEYEQLHFETCYYQGIDHCIQEKLNHFDAGAQGEHKVLRGFQPIETHSFHWLQHPEFSRAIDNFLQRESLHVAQYVQEMRRLLPFKKGNE